MGVNNKLKAGDKIYSWHRGLNDYYIFYEITKVITTELSENEIEIKCQINNWPDYFFIREKDIDNIETSNYFSNKKLLKEAMAFEKNKNRLYKKAINSPIAKDAAKRLKKIIKQLDKIAEWVDIEYAKIFRINDFEYKEILNELKTIINDCYGNIEKCAKLWISVVVTKEKTNKEIGG